MNCLCVDITVLICSIQYRAVLIIRLLVFHHLSLLRHCILCGASTWKVDWLVSLPEDFESASPLTIFHHHHHQQQQHPFNGPLSRTTRVSQYQKGKHTHTHTTVLRLYRFCLGQPGWAGTRRNIHSLTSIAPYQYFNKNWTIYFDNPVQTLFCRTVTIVDLEVSYLDHYK